MDDENNLDLPSLQDMITSSQGSDITFNGVWNDVCSELLNSGLDHVGLDSIMLDSTTLSSEGNQQDATLVQNALSGELETRNHAVVPSVQLPTQIPTIGSNVYQGSSSLPASENWPGEFNFTVSFSPQPKSTKGVAWTYSKIKDKLYVGKDAPCPINFSANTKLPDDVYVRVMALYTSPEQVTEIVERCLTHSLEDLKNGFREARHLIRCESSTVTYHSDAITGRHSVVVPFENPPAGQEYSTYIYKFACFGSCAGGPNRRPLMLIFTLERGSQVIGRKKLDVKICACPGRDKKTEESQYLALNVERPTHRTLMPLKRKQNSENVALSEIMDFTRHVYLPLPKKSKVTPNKDGLYVLTTEDIECYEFLKQTKKLYEICKTMRGVNPDVLTKALRQVHKVKNERNG